MEKATGSQRTTTVNEGSSKKRNCPNLDTPDIDTGVLPFMIMGVDLCGCTAPHPEELECSQHLGHVADAKRECINHKVGCLLGALPVFTGDDLARTDGV